jgi:hypothetical protein
MYDRSHGLLRSFGDFQLQSQKEWKTYLDDPTIQG